MKQARIGTDNGDAWLCVAHASTVPVFAASYDAEEHTARVAVTDPTTGAAVCVFAVDCRSGAILAARRMTETQQIDTQAFAGNLGAAAMRAIQLRLMEAVGLPESGSKQQAGCCKFPELEGFE